LKNKNNIHCTKQLQCKPVLGPCNPFDIDDLQPRSVHAQRVYSWHPATTTQLLVEKLKTRDNCTEQR